MRDHALFEHSGISRQQFRRPLAATSLVMVGLMQV